jgi:hypothetical protein
VAAPLSPFDGDVLAAVAAETGFDADALAALVERHGEYVRGYEAVGGVDGLVYEWRQSFFEDPLDAQDPETYYLAVPRRVWADFGERMDLSDAELDALRAVHDRQFRAERGEPEGEALVLAKPG